MDIKIKVKQNKHNIDVELKDTIVVYRGSGREPQTKEVEYVENGEYIITPDEGYILEQANVNVNVPIPEGYIKPEGNIDITTTDEYDVSNYVTAQIKDNNLIPENIAENVEVLGITGTFHGVVDTSDATATSDDILLDKTAYVDDKKVVGNIETWDGTFEGDVELYNPLIAYLNGDKNTFTKEDLEGITNIRDLAFYKQSIESIELPNSLKSIGDMAFFGCQNLTDTMIIPDSVTSIGNRPFSETKITSIIIGSGVTTWGSYACYNIQSLVSATVNSKTLGTSLFQANHSLSKVILGENVTTLGAYAFRECDGLTELICLAETPPVLENSVFINASGDFIIKVPANSVEAYKTSTNWSARADYIIAYEGD